MKTPQVAISFLDFCLKVLNMKLTLGQRVIAKVCYDGLNPEDLGGEEREVAAKVFGPVSRVTNHARRIVTLVAGRGSGKSSVLSSCRLLHLALTLPLGRLAAGEKGYCLIICPDLKTAKQTLEFVRGQAEASPFIAPLIGDKTSSSRNQQNGVRQDGFLITRPDGHVVSIECIAASKGGRSVRGRSLVCVVLDECAFFEDENHAVNDKEIFAALLPRMMKGSQLIIASTPWADSGLLYDLYSANFGNPQNSVVAVAPTLLMMPTEEMKEAVAAMELTEPERAQQEFHARFMAGTVGAWFDSQSIAECTDMHRKYELDPDPSLITVFGADLAFKKDNAALVGIQYLDGKFHVAVMRELKPTPEQPLTPSHVFGTFAAIIKRYGVDYAIADRYNEAPFREYLESSGMSLIHVPGGADGKAEIFSRAKTLMREGKVVFPDHPKFIKQLKMWEGKLTSGGKVSIDFVRSKSGDHGHGDLVAAFVAALYQAYKIVQGLEPEYVPGTLDWHKAQAVKKMDSYERRAIEEARAEDDDAAWDRAGYGIGSLGSSF